MFAFKVIKFILVKTIHSNWNVKIYPNLKTFSVRVHLPDEHIKVKILGF